MKIFSICILLILLTGCVQKQCYQPDITPKVVVETIEIKVPVYCKIPKIKCDFTGDGFMPVEKMRQCIIEQKRALEVCSKPN